MSNSKALDNVQFDCKKEEKGFFCLSTSQLRKLVEHLENYVDIDFPNNPKPDGIAFMQGVRVHPGSVKNTIELLPYTVDENKDLKYFRKQVLRVDGSIDVTLGYLNVTVGEPTHPIKPNSFVTVINNQSEGIGGPGGQSQPTPPTP